VQPYAQLAEKSFSGLCVASALDQNIQHIAILIHCSPKILPLPANGEIHLVHMPFVTTAMTATSQFIGVGLVEFEAPLTHGFVGHDDPALCQKFLNRTENSARSGNRAILRG